MSKQGVRLDLPLTHLTLSKLVSAQRPSVTNALGELRERKLLLRNEDRSWLLPLPIPEELEPLLARHALARAAGGARGSEGAGGRPDRVRAHTYRARTAGYYLTA